MKKWIPKILAYLIMIPIIIIGIVVSIVWNSALIFDMIFTNIIRRYKAGIKEMNKDDKKRKESYK